MIVVYGILGTIYVVGGFLSYGWHCEQGTNGFTDDRGFSSILWIFDWMVAAGRALSKVKW